MLGDGPRDEMTFAVPGDDPDVFLTLVRSAGAVVVYRAVEQDRAIFVDRIEPHVGP